MGIAMLPNDRLELPPSPDELTLTVPDGQASIVVEISKVRPGDVIRIRRLPRPPVLDEGLEWSGPGDEEGRG